MGKNMVIIIGIGHFIACIFAALGNGDDKEGWIPHYGYSLAEEDLLPRYLMSLHWSLSQFAGGMDEVTPVNMGERAYAIAVFLVAFIMASIFVSSITSSMTQLSLINGQPSQQLCTLK